MPERSTGLRDRSETEPDAAASWDHPDFTDPRFEIHYVGDAATCRHDGCDGLAAHLVEYSMRRDGWIYDYECGYCAEHLPAAAVAFVEKRNGEKT